MKKSRIFTLAVIFTLYLLFSSNIPDICANTAYKQSSTNPTENQPSSIIQTAQTETSPNYLSLFMKALGFVAFFIVFIYGYVKLNKNFLSVRNAKHDSANIQIIGSKIIGQKKSLYIVDVLEHVLLLGITDNEISVLLDVPSENLSTELKESWQTKKNTSEPIFKKITAHLLNK